MTWDLYNSLFERIPRGMTTAGRIVGLRRGVVLAGKPAGLATTPLGGESRRLSASRNARMQSRNDQEIST